MLLGGERSIWRTHCQPDLVLLRGGCSRRPSSVLEGNCSLTHKCELCMTLKDGRWRSISDATAGMARSIGRLHDRALPFAWITCLGVFSIPIFVVGKTIESWRDCLRCAEVYGIRWYEIQVVFVCSLLVHSLEAPGMWLAFRGKTTMDTQ